MSAADLKSSTNRKSEFIIVGGGIIGSAIAYYLAREGKDVLLLEADRMGSGSSGAAAGMLAPRLETFTAPALKEMAERSHRLMLPLIDELSKLSPIDVAVNHSGFVVPFTDSRMKNEHSIHQAYWNQFKLRTEIPAICEQAEGAFYFSEELQLVPSQFVKALAEGAKAKGARYVEQQSVTSLDIQDGVICGVETKEGMYCADQVIIASGLGTNDVLSTWGIDLRTVPVKGEIAAVSLPGMRLDHTIYTHDIYLVPKPGDEIWIGATSIPFDNSKHVSVQGIVRLLREASRWLPELEQASLVRSWAGLRPHTIDGLPYIGKYEGVKGLYIAAGHYRNGILLSAVTGEIISRLVAGESEEELGITEFSPMRVMQKGSVVH